MTTTVVYAGTTDGYTSQTKSGDADLFTGDVPTLTVVHAAAAGGVLSVGMIPI